MCETYITKNNKIWVDSKSYAVLKQQRDALLDACKGLMEKADNGSADFDDPEPGSIYLKAKAAIAKCE